LSRGRACRHIKRSRSTSRLRKNASECGSASFETRLGEALLRMRPVISKAYLTLRRPEGPSRRVVIRESRVFPQPARGSKWLPIGACGPWFA
jgi:hypothetical protein